MFIYYTRHRSDLFTFVICPLRMSMKIQKTKNKKHHLLYAVQNTTRLETLLLAPMHWNQYDCHSDCRSLPVRLGQSISRRLFAGRGGGGRQALSGRVTLRIGRRAQALQFTRWTGPWASSPSAQGRADTLCRQGGAGVVDAWRTRARRKGSISWEKCKKCKALTVVLREIEGENQIKPLNTVL